MGTTAVKDRQVEIRIRFEPGLGAALYASLREGDTGTLTVARVLGRGKALLHFHGVTLMAHGAPEWKAGESFTVAVKELGPPLVLAPVGTGREGRGNGGRGDRGERADRGVTVVETAVVPGSRPFGGDAPQARG